MTTETGITIGTTHFGMGYVTLNLENDRLSLSISGDEATANRIRDDESHPFHWILYPPRFYVEGVDVAEKDGSIQLNIDEDILDEYDIALYLIEHNDVYGTLTVSAGQDIRFDGTVIINNQEMPLRIVASAAVKTP